MSVNEVELVSNLHEQHLWARNFGSQIGIPYLQNGNNNKIYKELLYRLNQIISL